MGLRGHDLSEALSGSFGGEVLSKLSGGEGGGEGRSNVSHTQRRHPQRGQIGGKWGLGRGRRCEGKSE